MKINQIAEFVPAIRADLLVFAVEKCQKMKFRLAQAVIDARAFDLKIRHSVAGFDVKIPLFSLRERCAVINSDLRNKRENKFFNRVELKRETGDIRKNVRSQIRQNRFGTRDRD